MEHSSNTKKIRILIMDTPIGSGHVVAAKALKAEMEKQFTGAQILHISTFDFLPQLLSKTFLKLYLLSLRISPKIYAFLYKWGNKDQSTASRDRLNSILARLAYRRIVDFNPDIAIATHATPAGIITQLKAKGLLAECKVYGVVTDYVMHSWWYYKDVDAYFIANMPIDNICFADNQQVYKYGIPLRAEFAATSLLSKAQLRENLQLTSDEEVYLLLGGGEGILPMQELINAVRNYNPKAVVVAITGHNKRLYERLTGLDIKDLQVLGFVDKIKDYIAAADCVISKAGGISSTEILVQGAKYIVYKPLMGQEMNNALFLKNNFQVQIAESPKELLTVLALTSKQSENLTPAIASDSTECIVKEIFNLTKKHNYEYNV